MLQQAVARSLLQAACLNKAQNLYYNYYNPKPKCLIIRYMDPLGLLKPELVNDPVVLNSHSSQGIRSSRSWRIVIHIP